MFTKGGGTKDLNLQRIRSRAYDYNKTIVKVYGFGDNKKIKVTLMNCVKSKDIEIDKNLSSERGKVNTSKLDENLSRTKNKIFELAYCNKWDYFFTGTLNPNKHDRTDLELFHKQLTQFIRDTNKKYNCKIKFLFVPELHSDRKSWHIHGFLQGVPDNLLSQFKIGDKMGKVIAEKVQNGEIVYNWLDYSKKFGFCDLEPIKNHEAVSKYITKYINKELATSVTELNAHQYYHSRGLQMATKIKEGSMLWDNTTPSFQNDYCKIAWIDYSENALNEILHSFI